MNDVIIPAAEGQAASSANSAFSSADPQSRLVTLAEQQRINIEKFQEHIRFAANLLDDEKIKSVLAHLVDEESERIEEVSGLIEELRQTGGTVKTISATVPQGLAASSPPPAMTHAALSHDPTLGHYARRDQNILTVGNLLGQPQ